MYVVATNFCLALPCSCLAKHTNLFLSPVKPPPCPVLMWKLFSCLTESGAHSQKSGRGHSTAQPFGQTEPSRNQDGYIRLGNLDMTMLGYLGVAAQEYILYPGENLKWTLHCPPQFSGKTFFTDDIAHTTNTQSLISVLF